MFSGESDLNTSIVFSILSFRAFELTRGKTDFSFLSFEYSNTLLQGILWSEYEMTMIRINIILLLAYCCSTFESITCFFLSNIIPVFHSHIRDVRGDTTTTKLLLQLQIIPLEKLRKTLAEKQRFARTCCRIHLSHLRILRAAYFYDLVRKQDLTGLQL